MGVSVMVELNIVPGKFAEAGGIFGEALQATRDWEGCNSVEVYASESDSKYFFVEDFDKKEQWETYFEWRQKESGEVLESLLAGPLKVTFCVAKDFGLGRNR